MAEEFNLSPDEIDRLLSVINQLQHEMDVPALIDPDLKKRVVSRDPTANTMRGFADAVGAAVNVVTGGRDQERLRSMGVDPSKGAPVYSRFVASWPPAAQDQLQSQIFSLMQKYGRTEKGQLKFDATKDLVWEPRTESILFRDPENNKWHPVDPPGMDIGDPADLAGDVFQIASEIGAVLATVRGKGPYNKGPGKFAPRHKGFFDTTGSAVKNVGAESGAAAGSGFGRVKIGQKLGAYPDVSDEAVRAKAAEHATKSGLLAGAGSAVMRTGSKAVKGVANALTGKSLPTGTMETGLRILDSEAAPPIKRINERLAKANYPPMPESPGQRLSDPALLSAERRALETPALGVTEVVRDFKDRQVQGADNFFEHISEGYRVPNRAASPSRLETGRRAVEGVVRPHAQATRDLISGVDLTEASYIGTPIRGVAEDVRDRFSSWAGKAYDELRELSHGISVVPVESLKLARGNLGLFQQDLVPLLTVENQKILAQLIESVTGANAQNPGTFAVRNVDFEQMNRLISQLKGLERQLDVNPINGVDAKAVRDLRKAVVQDREAAILKSGNPELIGKFHDVEAQYALEKSKINDSVLGDLLSYRGGRPRIKDEAIFDRIFGPNKISEARLMSDILSDPKYVTQRRQMVDAILTKYLKEVAPDGVATPNRHAQWTDKYREVLEIWLRPGELEGLKNVGEASKLLRGIKDQQDNYMRAITDTFGQLDNLNPTTIVDSALSNPAKMQQLVEILEQTDREALLMLQDTSIDILKRRITGRNGFLQRDALSFAKLEKQLKDDKVVDSLRALHGDEYVSNLEVLKEALERTQQDSAYSNRSGTANALIDFVSKAQFVLGPLSHLGFQIGRISRAFASGLENNLLRILFDPEELARLTNASLTTNKSRQAQMLFGSLGLQYYMDNLGESATGAGKAEFERSGTVVPPSVLVLQRKIRNNPKLLEKLTSYP